MKYYIIAGEASGDLHGSKLLEGILAKDSSAEVRFWGGEKMAAVCPEGLVVDYRKTAVMGFADVIRSIGTILRRLQFCKQDIAAFEPDVVIFIDYPGFNLRMAKWAHNHGYKTVYYIAPKVWASREGRIEQLRKYVDRLIIIFPFEIPYFKEKGLQADYVGCPLVDIVNESTGSAGALSGEAGGANAGSGAGETGETGAGKAGGAVAGAGSRTIAMLAGSRTSEIRTMLGPLQDFARRFHAKHPEYRFVLAAAPGRTPSDYPIDADLQGLVDVAFGRTYEVIRSADVAVVNSGTASLETLILNVPQVVGYVVGSGLSYAIGRMIIRVKFISLGNLCANKLIFKELIQDDCTGEKIFEEVERLVSDEAYRGEMLSEYAKVQAMLRGEAVETVEQKSGEAVEAACGNTEPAAYKAAAICCEVAREW